MDQGCPLSPAFFSASLAPILEDLSRELRALDASSEVFAYLDDIFVVISGAHAAAACEAAGRAMGRLGLELEKSKTKVWIPDAKSPTPHGLSDLRVTQLRCLGNTLSYARAVAEEGEEGEGADRVPITATASFPEVTKALLSFLQCIRDLQASGLRKQTAWTLFRTYVGGANNHVLRGCWADASWCHEYDCHVAAFVEELIGASLGQHQRQQLFLPLSLGGCGLASTSFRRAAALIGSWEQFFTDVDQVPELRQQVRCLHRSLWLPRPWRKRRVTSVAWAWQALSQIGPDALTLHGPAADRGS